MMGERTVLQESLFYSFNLDRHVPMDHMLRSVDRFVDLSGIREHLKPLSSPHEVIRTKCQCRASFGVADPVGPGELGSMGSTVSITSGAGGR
jgi:hypothetical protein